MARHIHPHKKADFEVTDTQNAHGKLTTESVVRCAHSAKWKSTEHGEAFDSTEINTIYSLEWSKRYLHIPTYTQYIREREGGEIIGPPHVQSGVVTTQSRRSE